ncbi:ergosterol 28 [Morchella conica CCBAS932]|uniref:Ergosterol 28 n=1 Tax=Morchella conica CCBAS932 TaxID=1392247 RepID=A0A3N4KBW5_9PEZI|nr:ergosterol 28 [Morchella conica CCBAS932]
MSELISQVLSYLPQDEGWLPKWMFLVSVIAVGNSVQTYMTLHFTKRVYSGRPDQVNWLSSRTFGTWTFMASVLRLYAAYNITNPVVYDLAIWSYIIAGWHFLSEWLIFGTASWGAGLAGPICVSSLSTVWMITQRGLY